jgi:hypothetical protein
MISTVIQITAFYKMYYWKMIWYSTQKGRFLFHAMDMQLKNYSGANRTAGYYETLLGRIEYAFKQYPLITAIEYYCLHTRAWSIQVSRPLFEKYVYTMMGLAGGRLKESLQAWVEKIFAVIGFTKDRRYHGNKRLQHVRGSLRRGSLSWKCKSGLLRPEKNFQAQRSKSKE